LRSVALDPGVNLLRFVKVVRDGGVDKIDGEVDRCCRRGGVSEELQSDLRWVGTFPRLGQRVEAVNHDFNEWSVKALESWVSLHENATSGAGSHA
jgi:hypothetical protein